MDHSDLLRRATAFNMGDGVELVTSAPLRYPEGCWYFRRADAGGVHELLHKEFGWKPHYQVTDGGFLFPSVDEAVAFYERLPLSRNAKLRQAGSSLPGA